MDNSILVDQLKDIIFMAIQGHSDLHASFCDILLDCLRNNQMQLLGWLENVILIITQQNYKDESTYVEKVIAFFVLFCTSEETIEHSATYGGSLAHEYVLYLLLDLHDSENATMRYRCCQLISKVLDKIENIKLSDELSRNIPTALLERLDDIKFGVRVQAVYAIHFFQDPFDRDCLITKQLIRHTCDVVPQVRQAAVSKLIIFDSDSVEAVLRCAQDINFNVRHAAYMKLTNCCEYLEIVQRQTVIRLGFNDKNKDVKLYVESELIKSWLTNYNNNVLVFLYNIMVPGDDEDLKKSTEACRLAMDSVFNILRTNKIMEVLTLSQEFTIPLETISWQSAVFWRVLIESCRGSNALAINIRCILPYSAIIFMDYIRRFCYDYNDLYEFPFILTELVAIIAGYDFVNLQEIKILLRNLVVSILTTLNLSKGVVLTILKTIVKSVLMDLRAEFIFDTMFEIKCSEGHQIPHSNTITTRVSQLEQRAEVLKFNCSVALSARDFKQACICESLANRIGITSEELKFVSKCDPIILCRRWTLFQAYLEIETTNIFFSCTRFKSLYDQLFMILRSTDLKKLRLIALDCHASLCKKDRDIALKGINFFFFSVFQFDSDVDILLVSIQAIIDILCIYGPTIIASSENDEYVMRIFSFTDAIGLVETQLDHENLAIQQVAIQGLSRLIVDGKIQSDVLIARLINKIAQPSSLQNYHLP